MRNKSPRVSLSVCVTLLIAPIFGSCSQSQSAFHIPAEYATTLNDAPTVISFSSDHPQVSVETMLVMVPTKLLEQSAVLKDLNPPVEPKSPPLRAGNVNDSLSGNNPRSIILDKKGYSEFLVEIQSNQRLLASPQFNLASGQLTSFAMTKSIRYVKTAERIDPPAGSDARPVVKLNPQTLTTGIWLEFAATISSDEKHLTTTVHPTLISLDGIDTFLTENTPGPVAFVQLPKTTTMTFSVSNSVPDGGTLLLVGPKRVEVSEIGATGLGGLFGRRSYISDEYTFVVIIRPVIGPPTDTTTKGLSTGSTRAL